MVAVGRKWKEERGKNKAPLGLSSFIAWGKLG
jgi:hypothetical protein